MGKTFLETSILKIGSSAADFLSENMLILFQENAPAALAEFCYLIGRGVGSYDIRVGDVISFGDASYTITAIGNVALQNFQQLGHLTLRFDGAAAAAQPGTVHVSPQQPPAPCVGMSIRFSRA